MKNAKRALSLVLVLALALSMCVIGAGAANYSDVPSTYSYSNEVQFLSDIEVITGYPDGTFQPEGIITRAEAAAVVFRALAGKESAAENYQGATVFSDVSAAHWACGYVNFCTEMGIINGYPDGTFRPDQTITYAEYVTMLARALGLDMGKDLSYPYGYIAEATVEGINYGVDLAAQADCPRGAVAKLTYNAIFDATYRRIANNIYTTEKPTIAKDVLKLEDVTGVVTSVDDYSWIDKSAVGEGYFEVIDLNNSTNINKMIKTEEGYGIFKYDIDPALLGKEVKVWFKPDSVTASGAKVYAVVEQKNTTATLPQIVIKGATAGKANEITYALNDVDYKAKLDDNCIFVENNEFIGTMMNDADGTFDDFQMDATTFYAPGIRAWLPINYTFIDNDADGKYEVVVRKIYQAAQVDSMTANKLNLEGISSIDRKDTKGTAYAWNDGLADVEADDWVIFYADGSVTDKKYDIALDDDGDGEVTTTEGYAGTYAVAGGIINFIKNAKPDFSDDTLYGDTGYAEFSKLTAATLAVESIVDHDQFVFDGTTYRLGTGYSAFTSDLDIDADLGDEFDLWCTTGFGGIIFSAESYSVNTGKYMVINDMDDISGSLLMSKNFDIEATNEEGDKDTFTVKSDKKKKLTIVNNTGSSVTIAGTTITDGDDEEIALLNENLLDVASEVSGPFLIEYKNNSNGQVTAMKVFMGEYAVANTTASAELKDYYRNGILKTSEGKYIIQDNSLVFVVYADPDKDAKVFVGGFPKMMDGSNGAYGYIYGVDSKTTSDGTAVKAMVVYVDGTTSGGTDKEDLAGYLRNVYKRSSDDGVYYEYEIAYNNGDADTAASVMFKSRVAKDADDLETVVDDDTLIDNTSWKAHGTQAEIILFNIQADGTIAEMRYVEDEGLNDTTSVPGLWLVDTSSDNSYTGSYMVTAIDTKRNAITVVPVANGANMSAKVASTSVEVVTDYEETYYIGDDAIAFLIDNKSTNKAKTTTDALGAIDIIDVNADGSIGTDNEGTVIGFAFDKDAKEITAIFVNDDDEIEATEA